MSRCWICRGDELAPVSRVTEVPRTTMTLAGCPTTARRVPRVTMDLRLCLDCEFLFDAALAPDSGIRGAGDDWNQAASGAFLEYQRQLARELTALAAIPAGGRVVAVGPGGEPLLDALRAGISCETAVQDPWTAGARGPGPGSPGQPTAPACPDREPGRARCRAVGQLHVPGSSFVHHPLTGATGAPHGVADLTFSRMFLEHMTDPAQLVHFMALQARPGTGRVYLQVPDAAHILRLGAFWDLYPEHVGYYSEAPLRRLLRDAGLEVELTHTRFGGQHLGVLARRTVGTPRHLDDALGTATRAHAQRFSRVAADSRQGWREALADFTGRGRPVVLWGAGPRSVIFITSTGSETAIAAVVDIHPARQGRFLPGSGIPVVAPATLRDIDPALVLVMNASYEVEIRRQVEELGLGARVATMERTRPDTLETSGPACAHRPRFPSRELHRLQGTGDPGGPAHSDATGNAGNSVPRRGAGALDLEEAA